MSRPVPATIRPRGPAEEEAAAGRCRAGGGGRGGRAARRGERGSLPPSYFIGALEGTAGAGASPSGANQTPTGPSRRRGGGGAQAPGGGGGGGPTAAPGAGTPRGGSPVALRGGRAGLPRGRRRRRARRVPGLSRKGGARPFPPLLSLPGSLFFAPFVLPLLGVRPKFPRGGVGGGGVGGAEKSC